MSATPERIWAWAQDGEDKDRYPTVETGWEETDDLASWYADRGKPLTEYRRADLPPTLAQAMMVPEVRELVEGVWEAKTLLDHWIHGEGASLFDVHDKLRAALHRIGETK